MTGRAILSKRALMEIICGMAGETICGCALKDVIDMAFGTGRAGMLSCQREG